MSKYKERGAYHYNEFKLPTIYRQHVLDLVEQVEWFVPSGGEILDVGAGEGLILSKLVEIGFVVCGCDIDQTAVDLACGKGNNVVLGQIHGFEGRSFDAVMLCDVLEHVEDPIRTMAAARSMAPIVLIAVPDRKDKHATHEVGPLAIEDYMRGYNLVHKSQRHARHLMIFKRQDD